VTIIGGKDAPASAARGMGKIAFSVFGKPILGTTQSGEHKDDGGLKRYFLRYLSNGGEGSSIHKEMAKKVGNLLLWSENSRKIP